MQNTLGPTPTYTELQLFFRYEDRAIHMEHRLTLLETTLMDHSRRLAKIDREPKDSLWNSPALQIALGIAMVAGALLVRLITFEQAQSVISWLISNMK